MSEHSRTPQHSIARNILYCTVACTIVHAMLYFVFVHLGVFRDSVISNSIFVLSISPWLLAELAGMPVDNPFRIVFHVPFFRPTFLGTLICVVTWVTVYWFLSWAGLMIVHWRAGLRKNL